MMSAPRPPAIYTCRAPAKLNLFLEVVGRRADGYHDLDMVTTAISLWDQLWFQPTRDGVLRVDTRIDARLAGSAVPEWNDDRNVAWRALERLRVRAGDSHLGGYLRIDKYIPWEGGLGGGSSDAAAAILLADQAWDLRLDRESLREVGARVGSDVPLFFAAGTARCRGRGEQVDPVPNRHRLWFVVVKPAVGLSTAAVFSRFQLQQPLRSPAAMLAALHGGSVTQVALQLWNRLTSTAVTMCDGIDQVLAGIRQTRPLGTLMTGSGTSCFGIYRNRAQAESARFRLAAALPHCRTLVCRALNGGVQEGAGRIIVRALCDRIGFRR